MLGVSPSTEQRNRQQWPANDEGPQGPEEGRSAHCLPPFCSDLVTAMDVVLVRGGARSVCDRALEILRAGGARVSQGSPEKQHQ